MANQAPTSEHLSAHAPRGSDTVRRPPAPLTATIGREDDLARVLAAIAEHRLVTVVGPGGVGKTRLTVDVARQAAADGVFGAAFVELAPVAVAADVAPTIVRSLGLHTAPGGELEGIAHLGTLDALVLLDNCEHVVAEVAEVAARMLAGGSALRVLASSREPLGVDGECVVVLEPLPAAAAGSPAVQLLQQRARMASAIGPLDDGTAVALAAALDGLPLALEMAAARLRTTSPRDLLASLGEAPHLLSSSRRDVTDRHRTVRDLVAWSEELLDDDLREAFWAMSVFAGDVAARDLAAVLRDGRPLDAVARLVDRSLVRTVVRGDEVRYGLLQIVRSHAAERLRERGLGDERARLHAEWFLGVLREVDADLRTPREGGATARFLDVFDEVRAAVRWAIAADLDVAVDLVLHAAAVCRPLLRHELTAWALELRDRMPPDHPELATVLAAVASGLSISGRLTEAREAAERSIELSPDGRGALLAIEALGDVALYEGRFADVISACEVAHRRATEQGDPLYAGIATMGASLARLYGGDPDAARETIEEVDTRIPTLAAWREYVLGESMLDTEPSEALVHLDRASAIAVAAGNRFVDEVARLSASTVVARTSAPGDAVPRFRELLDDFAYGGDAAHLLTTLRNGVTLLARLGQHAAAAELHGAVAEHPSSPTFGAEAERLAAAATACREALGATRFDALAARGALRSLEEAREIARAALTPGADDGRDPEPDPDLAGSPRSTPASTASLIRRQDTWSVTFQGRTVVVRHLKGLADLAVLLARSGSEVHALELIGGFDVGGAAGPIVDDTARDSYRRRIVELQHEIDDATVANDPHRAERAEVELDAIVAQLSEAFGLGGRTRSTGASHERARSTVTVRIRAAIRKLREVHEPLGRHLANAVRTGTWCSYQPEQELRWVVDATGDPEGVGAAAAGGSRREPDLRDGGVTS